MLQRLKSVSFYNYRSHEPNTHFGKTLEMETLHGFLQQGSELGQEQEGESEKGTPFLTRSPSMPNRTGSSRSISTSVCPKKPAFHRPITVLSYPQELEQHEAQAEEEEQVDPVGDDEPEEQDEQEVEEVEEDKEEDEQSFNDVYSQLKDNQVKKIKTGTKPTSGDSNCTFPLPTSSNV
ncbi:hypothetical protein NL676_012407 [Syzygium grande]|nr:hypothetical protein NL676_012407 [Syzygium grande]